MKFILAFLFVTAVITQDQVLRNHFEDSAPVITMKDHDFFLATRLESQPERNWFVMFYADWSVPCQILIPVWEETARKLRDGIHVGAIDTYQNEDIRDRIGINKFPTFIFFDMDKKMYRYQGEQDYDNFVDFVENERWKEPPYVGKNVPKEINQWKRFLRKLVSLWVIIPAIIIVIIILLICICIESGKRSKVNERRRIEELQQKIQRKKQEYIEQNLQKQKLE